MRTFTRMLAASLLAVISLAAPALAQAIRIGVSSPISSVDPHFQNLVPNIAVSQHIFDQLLAPDAEGRPQPGLAESLTQVDDTTWEAKLRRGVRFHDGSELTAEDVVWSIERPPTVARSPAPFTIYTRGVESMTIVDPHTVRFKTRGLYPLLPLDLAQVFIMSKKAAQNISLEEFNRGVGIVGTGPYRFVRYTPEDRIELERFAEHWRGRPTWERVTIRFMSNDATRLAALLAGDVDAIDQIGTADIAAVRANPALAFVQKPSFRIIYFFVDQGREQTPHVTAKDGSPLQRNPLQDLRVRRAISMAISRDAIRDRIMEGASLPSSQFILPIMYDGDDIPQTAFDAAGARRLLTEAGFPDGFRMTIHGPNNRFVNDGKIVEAVAQMLTRIGIQASIDTMPMGAYAGRGARGEFSFGLIGWGAQTGDVSTTLRSIIACENRERGMGPFNWSRYCNAKVDELTAQALATADGRRRNAILREAAKLAASEGAIVPIHFQSTTWAARRNVAATIEGRADERTLAMSFRPGGN
jgi:peptide/nickel transport system substrate-binding protein